MEAIQRANMSNIHECFKPGLGDPVVQPLYWTKKEVSGQLNGVAPSYRAENNHKIAPNALLNFIV